MQDYLTTQQAAAFFGVQQCTLEAWRCRGGGPQYVKMGRSVRYRMADLIAWAAARTKAHSSALDERTAA